LEGRTSDFKVLGGWDRQRGRTVVSGCGRRIARFSGFGVRRLLGYLRRRLARGTPSLTAERA
jgi:hypothetical protein